MFQDTLKVGFCLRGISVHLLLFIHCVHQATEKTKQSTDLSWETFCSGETLRLKT